MSIRQFQCYRTEREVPADVVRLVISKVEERAVADVVWPANAKTDGGDYFYPTYVPLAIERALDVQDNYSFRAVVVVVEDFALWDDGWGRLIT